MHAQLVQYDVRDSDGATVGFNCDQTIGPGESITYRWYIDQDFGAANLWDMADIRNHRHHGAFGMLIAEPRGSKYLSSKNRKEVETGSQVIISNPLLPEFREFALLMHDGVRLLDKDDRLIIDPEPLIFGTEKKNKKSLILKIKVLEVSIIEMNGLAIELKSFEIFIKYLVQKYSKIQVHHYF